ncbi:MAG TPA: hypothetical protein DDW54_00155 [Clostridiales bacterium]|nr:hypothetical protein [Clostridiales bacterium]
MIFSILYSLYSLSSAMAEIYAETGLGYDGLTAAGYLLFMSLQLGIFFAGFAAYYLFRGFGLYKAAKRRGRGRAYLAFVPFAALYLLGSLSVYPEDKPKKPVISWLAISFSAARFLVMIIIDALFAVNPLKALFSGEPLTAGSFSPIFELGAVSPTGLYNFLAVIEQVLTVAVLVFLTILLSNYVKVYRPSKMTVYSVVSALVYFFFGIYLFYGIFVFVCGKEDPKDYSEYMAQRYRAVYGGAYRPQKEEKPEDPFEEFSQGKDADPFSELNSGGNGENGENKSDDPTDPYSRGEDIDDNGDGSDDLF